MSSSTSPVTGDRLAAPGDRRWLILIVVAIAQLMVVLDSTIVNIALPSAQRALGFPNSDRQWVVTAYALAFGSLLLVGGRLGDMFSRERVFITGLIGFAVASAIGGASVSFTMLVAARALQGAFGAVLAPSALGTLVSTFREPRERARAFGVFGSVAAGGGAVGLILGGVLTQYVSWRWTLYVNLVFAAIAVAGALAWIRPSRPDARPRMDWPGAVLACAGLFLIVFGFSRGETAGWTAPQTLGSLAAGLVLLAGFVVAEQRSSHPLLPLRVILDRTRGGSYAAVFISGIAIFATFLFLTYYLQVIKAESPLATGLLFLPMVGCILISSNLSSIVGLARFGPRVLIATGMLLGAGGMAYLTRVSVTSSYASAVLPALLILGPGLRHDLRAGHQHRYLRRRPPGLRRRLRTGQHDAAGRRLDRDIGSQHDRAQYGGQLPDHPPHQPACTGDRGHPRLHRRLQRVSSAARARLHPRDRPAPVQAPAYRAQERRRHLRPGCRRPGPGPIACRPRPAAGVRGDSRGPVRLLAASDRGSRPGGHAGPLEPTAGQASDGCPARTPAQGHRGYPPSMSTTTPPATDLRLVVGYDGSPPASRALEAAVNLLQGRTGRIEVVYVAHMPSMAALSPGAVAELETDFDDIEQELRTMAAEQLRDREQRWDFHRRQGLIAEELIAAGKDLGAAHPHATVVIVVGSSSLVAHRVVGSVAVSLARHSPVPLVVVP